jgi:predicted nicotinamide N-methyase
MYSSPWIRFFLCIEVISCFLYFAQSYDTSTLPLFGLSRANRWAWPTKMHIAQNRHSWGGGRDRFFLESHRPWMTFLLISSLSSTLFDEVVHTVDDMVCVEILILLPHLGTITLLEATAQTQEDLVNLALLMEGDDPSMTETNGGSDNNNNMTPLQDPYGAVLWPASLALAHYLLHSNPHFFQDQVVWEVGTGTGLLSLAAGVGGARHVWATDYEDRPLRLLEYAAHHLNPVCYNNHDRNATNAPAVPIDWSSVLTCQQVDVCHFTSASTHTSTTTTTNKKRHWDCDILLVADLLYEPRTAVCLAEQVLLPALRAGVPHVYVADSPGRPGRNALLHALHHGGISHAAFVDIPGTTVAGRPRHELICGPGSMTTSEQPQALTVALLHLTPQDLRPINATAINN